MSQDDDDTDQELFSRGYDGEVFQMNGRLSQDNFDDMLDWLKEKKASDVSIASGEPVWAEIGGKQIRVTRKKISHHEVADILRLIYGDNGPGMVNAGQPLDFAYDLRRAAGRMRFRVNVTGGNMIGGRGAQMTIRTLPTVPPSIEQLELEPEILEYFRPPQGLNLITGPTGSGKSTLMSALIRWRCEMEDANEKVVEFSKPIEYVYYGLDFPSSNIWQTEPGDHLCPTGIEAHESGSLWASAVSNALRRAPKIIVIGEARDRATFEAIIQASLTGHLSMSTMHTIGVPESIRRALMFFPGSERRGISIDLLECLNLLVTQLLLPRVGGGKVGCREFMVFDRKVRIALNSLDPEEWPGKIREMLNERRVIGRSMADSARELLQANKITSETFEWVAARSSGESKVVRQAMGNRLYDDQEMD